MEQPRSLKRDSSAASSTSASGSVDTMTAACANELLNAAVTFHKLHLKVKGAGSYAAHVALNDLYDALPGHADNLVEGYQGACEMLLDIPDNAPKKVSTVEEGLGYIRALIGMVTMLQSKMPYSEIVNELDTVKSTLNSAKYKLTFLK